MKRRQLRHLPQAGMTMIELLMVILILGILANILMPAMLYQIQKARATAVVNDFLYFRNAVLQYHLDNDAYPRDRARRREPPELASYLQGRMNWDVPHLGYDYDWDNWVKADGSLKKPKTGVRVAFTVFTKNTAFRDLLDKVYDGPIVRRGNRIHFLIEG